MPETPDPIETAARALRYRDRSRRELDERLARAGVDETRRAEALARLERAGYVDDGRFAGQRAAALAGRGFGDAAIRQLLADDGVEEDTVERTMAALEPERERARRLVARHGASVRTAARLQRKGFAEDAVESALGGGFAAEGPEA